MYVVSKKQITKASAEKHDINQSQNANSRLIGIVNETKTNKL